jgi:putative endonuclease
MRYWLYIVECADGTLYTGIATDVQRRVLEHNGADCIGKNGQAIKGKGARYTSARRPVSLVFETAFATRSDALKEELRIKRMTRPQKEALIAAVDGGARLTRS